ncbi:hypothetical protein BD413DRAFT_465182 [Trametes elegans]|nr:hypothetical protein BD413DRAFT_465182 [Trametes elegans]
MSPVLSGRARRQTPQIGQSTFTSQLPQSSKHMLRGCRLEKATDVVPDENLVCTDDVLGHRLHVNAETHRSVVTLIRSVPTLSKNAAIPAPHYVEDFLRAESASPDLPVFETLPIFPRNAHLGGHPEGANLTRDKTGSTTFESFHGLPKSVLSPVAMKEEDEDDLANEHLVVVDGWQAIRTSSPVSPGTPSLADSSSEVDELFMPSSPKSEVSYGGPPRMEEHQLPRSERIGGVRFKPHLPGQGASDDSIGFAVKTVERACGDRLGSEDPTCIVLQEKLEEKDSMLMDVPPMRAPNEHAIDFAAPARLSELLAVTKQSTRDSITAGAGGSTMKTPAGFLRKARGLQSLQIELSWIPFKYGRTVPTDEEVADVLNDPCPQLTRSIDLAQDEITSRLAALVDECMVFGSQPVTVDTAPSTVIWSLDANDTDGAPHWPPPSSEEEHSLILTQSDRRGLAGNPMFPDSQDEDEGDDRSEYALGSPANALSAKGGSIEARHAPRSLGESQGERMRPSKRVRFHESVLEHMTQDVPLPGGQLADDSGVYLWNDDAAAGNEHSSFGELAYAAEGFEGPKADDDLFPDLDPVHSGDYRYDHPPARYLQNFSHSHRQSTVVPGSSSRDRFHHPGLEDMECTDYPAADLSLHQTAAHDGRGFFSPTLLSVPALVSTESTSAVLSAPTQQYLSQIASAQTGTHDPRPSAATDVSARNSLAQFLALCGKSALVASSHVSQTPPNIVDSDNGALESSGLEAQPVGHNAGVIPLELVNNRTLLLPAVNMPPITAHRYMASVELIQKRSLVRALSSLCAVDLAEREHLGADAEHVQLILDCETAILLANVEALPMRVDALTAALTRLSWRFSRLLLLFECYPSSWNYKLDQGFADKETASVWSPPVVKAVKKLRRDLGVAEGLQTKRTAAVIEYAFASTVEEAAMYARLYGDTSALQGGTGDVSRDISWLSCDERDGEYDLCGVDGMNIYAASSLLSQTTLEDFLEKSADERMLEYGELVGMDRIARFNVEMARRLEAMQLPPSSPINFETSSSSNTIPYIEDSELDDTY